MLHSSGGTKDEGQAEGSAGRAGRKGWGLHQAAPGVRMPARRSGNVTFGNHLVGRQLVCAPLDPAEYSIADWHAANLAECKPAQRRAAKLVERNASVQPSPQGPASNRRGPRIGHRVHTLHRLCESPACRPLPHRVPSSRPLLPLRGPRPDQQRPPIERRVRPRHRPCGGKERDGPLSAPSALNETKKFLR